MKKAVVTELDADEIGIYEDIRRYGIHAHEYAGGNFPNEYRERGQRRMNRIGMIPGAVRVLNGHEYPIFDSEVNYCRYLRYGMTFPQHMQHDIDVWYETIRTNVSPPAKHAFLVKLFSVLRYNDFRWKAGAPHGTIDSYGRPDDVGEPYAWPLASALAHGSRVSIIVPKPQYDGFREWLTHSASGYGWGKAIYHRWLGMSTHSATVVNTGHGPDVDESKGVATGAYGMDIGCGVLGGPSGVQGRTISDDGSCGHIFMYESNHYNLAGWFERSREYKVVMVGIEASGASGGDDLYGSNHGTGAEQNGTGVSIYWHRNIGASNYVGMDSIPEGRHGASDVPAKYGGMVVHLTQTMAQIRQHYLNINTWDKLKDVLEYVPGDNQLGNGAMNEDGFVVV